MRASSAVRHFVESAKCFLKTAGGDARELALNAGLVSVFFEILAGNSTTAERASSKA
jgi:hypothetical protein